MMNTQQLKERTFLVPGYSNFGKEVTLSYIDADAFLAAVERLASVPESLKGEL
jgi:hypothetical protein